MEGVWPWPLLARRPLPWDPPLTALAGAFLVFCGFLLSGAASVPVMVVAVGIATAAADVALILTAAAAAAAARGHVGAVRFWSAVSLGGGCYLVADLMVLADAVRSPVPDGVLPGTIPNIVGTAGVVVSVVALLIHPAAADTHRERVRFWLDAGTVMVGAVVYAWYLLIVPRGFGTDRLQGTVLAVMAAALLGGLFAVVKIVLTRQRPMTKTVAALIAAAAVATIPPGEADLLEPGDVPAAGAVRLLAPVLVVAACRMQVLQVRADPGLLERSPGRRFSTLPYLAVAATFALLVYVLPADLDTAAKGVVTATLAGTVLVVIRQLTVFADNDRLIARLDESLREARQLQRQLWLQAHHDPLTGLANRLLFTQRLVEAVSQASSTERSEHTGVAAVLIDLDGFKEINDTYGHHVGDAALVAVARLITSSFRAEDVAARLGGDEFAVLLEDVPVDLAAGLAARLLRALADPLPIAGTSLPVAASIGVALMRPGSTAEDLLRQADAAMYEAKARGKGRIATIGLP